MAEEDQVKVTEEFRKWVKEWVEWDDTLSDAALESKAVKKRKDNLTEKISKYMELNGLESINITGGTIDRETKSTPAPVNKMYLAEVLSTEDC